MMRYFDHAATSPMRPEARTAYVEASHFLNPASQYAAGRQARAALETAREEIAQLLGCEPIEVIFTASGTEADVTAIRGLYRTRVAAGAPARLVASPLEHPAVRESIAPYEVEYFPVEAGAVCDFSALDEPAALATCMMANNETGALQPVAKLGAYAAEQGIPLHIDAVQAVGHIPVNFAELGATTLAASAHKFGGPRGVGLLVARRSPAPMPLIVGGGQERGIRSGTVNVAGAVATAAALRVAHAEMDAEIARMQGLRDELRALICAEIPDVVVHTPEAALPGHLHVSFPGAEGDSLIMLLDAAQMAASTGSACSQGVNRASEVLLAMGVSEQVARGAIRFSLGYTTTAEDIAALGALLPQVVAQARRAGMA